MADNKLIIANQQENSIKVFDLLTGQEMLCIKPQYLLKYVFPTSNNRYIAASFYNDYFVRIWDLRSGECLHNVKISHSFKNGHKTPDLYITKVILADDKETLTTESFHFGFHVWRSHTNFNINNLKKEYVKIAKFMGEKYLIAARDNKIEVWNIKKAKLAKTIKLENNDPIKSIEVTHDRKYIVVVQEESISIFPNSYGKWGKFNHELKKENDLASVIGFLGTHFS